MNRRGCTEKAVEDSQQLMTSHTHHAGYIYITVIFQVEHHHNIINYTCTDISAQDINGLSQEAK